MKFSLFMAFVVGMTTTVAHAAVDVSELRATFEASKVAVDESLAQMRGACGGISTELNELRKMAGIGVGVSAAGIVSAGVATGVGIKKSELDAVAMNKNVFKEKWEELKRDHAASDGQITWTTPEVSAVNDFIAQIEEMQPYDIPTDVLSNAESELRMARQNSAEGKRGKILGDVRTGTLVAGTVTNVVGAAVSGANVANKDLQGHVNECIDMAGKMKRVVMQARMDRDAYNNALTNVKTIKEDETADAIMSNRYIVGIDNAVHACEEWSTIDVVKIGKRAGGAMATGIIGAATGVAGTITSALANKSDTRLSGTDKEKNLNVAANALSGTTAVVSGVSTVLGATQISLIKKAALVDDNCVGALNIE